MVDFANWLAWDLLNYGMNPKLRTMISLSVSTPGSTSNSVPSAISASDSSSVSSILSPAANGSKPMQLFKADIEWHMLVKSEDLDGSGQARWRQCCIGKCEGSINKGECPKIPCICDHQSCPTFFYTHGKEIYTGKIVSRSSFDEHKNLVTNMWVHLISPRANSL